MRLLAAALLAATALCARPAGAALINGGFEAPAFAGTGYQLVNQSTVPGWRTTASDGVIEIWHGNFQGVTAREGRQHAELNANLVSTLYQDLGGLPAGAVATFRFAHRGRNGVDTLRFTLTDLGANGLPGGGDDTALFSNTYATGNTAWSVFSGANILLLGNTVRFAFQSVSAAGGSNSIGNFLDDVSLETVAATAAVLSEPVPLALLAMPLLGLLALRGRVPIRITGSAPRPPR